MDIHKVKPIHSWRDFVKELGTIVLGICIALAGEQALEWNHWRNQVQEARTVIATEMTYNLVGAIAHMRALECTDRRLDDLSKILDAAARTGSLPPIGNIAAPPRHRWESGAWDSVVASQTATHFPPEQLAALTRLYKNVERAELYSTHEMEDWGDLFAMVGPGRRLDPASEADLRKSLGRARDDSRTLATVSAFMVVLAANLNLPFRPSERDELDYVKKRPLTGEKIHNDNASTSPICGPIGAVPPNYGESPSKGTVALTDQATKALAALGKGKP